MAEAGETISAGALRITQPAEMNELEMEQLSYQYLDFSTLDINLCDSLRLGACCRNYAPTSYCFTLPWLSYQLIDGSVSIPAIKRPAFMDDSPTPYDADGMDQGLLYYFVQFGRARDA